MIILSIPNSGWPEGPLFSKGSTVSWDNTHRFIPIHGLLSPQRFRSRSKWRAERCGGRLPWILDAPSITGCFKGTWLFGINCTIQQFFKSKFNAPVPQVRQSGHFYTMYFCNIAFKYEASLLSPQKTPPNDWSDRRPEDIILTFFWSQKFRPCMGIASWMIIP